MANYDNAYSRFVAWAKILLPLAALGLLSTMFLLSKSVDPGATLDISSRDMTTLIEGDGMNAPRFAGVTEDGAALTVSAERAVSLQGPSGPVNAIELYASISRGDQGQTDVYAPQGLIDTAADQVLLQGGVTIANSSGYRVLTDEVTTRLDRTELQTAGHVSGKGPVGTIEAGRMSVRPSPSGGRGTLTLFEDGVTLVYLPNVRE